MAAARPANPRILLTSTGRRRLPSVRLPGTVIVAVEDVIGSGDALRIDQHALATRMSQDWADENGPVWLSPDGSKLVLAGSVTVTFRSEIHRTVIGRLVEGFSRGERFKAGDLLAEAGSNVMTFRKAFGSTKWKLLEPYLKSRNGTWGFEF